MLLRTPRSHPPESCSGSNGPHLYITSYRRWRTPRPFRWVGFLIALFLVATRPCFYSRILLLSFSISPLFILASFAADFVQVSQDQAFADVKAHFSKHKMFRAEYYRSSQAVLKSCPGVDARKR